MSIVYQIKIEDAGSKPVREIARAVSSLDKALKFANKRVISSIKNIAQMGRAYSRLAEQMKGVRRMSTDMGRATSANVRALRSMKVQHVTRYARALARVARGFARIAIDARRASRALRGETSQARRAAKAHARLAVSSRASAAARRGAGAGAGGGLRGGIAAAAGPSVALAAVAAAGVGAGLFATKKVFDMTAQLDRLELAFEAVGIGAKRGLGAAGEIAQKTGQKMTVAAERLLQLRTRGFSFDMAKELALRGADLKAIGRTEQEIASMMRQLGQMKGLGKLMGEELNIISEAGIPVDLIFKQMSEATGKTREELNKLKETGKLTSDVAIPAILDAMKEMTGGKAAGDVAEGFKASLMGIVGVLGSSAEQLMVRISRTLGKKPFQGVLSEISAQMGRISDKDLNKFAGVIKRILASLEVAVFLGGEFVKGFADALSPMKEGEFNLKEIKNTLQPIANAMGKIAGYVLELSFEGVKSQALGLGMAIIELESRVESLFFAVEKTIAGFKVLFALGTRDFMGAVAAVKDFERLRQQSNALPERTAKRKAALLGFGEPSAPAAAAAAPGGVTGRSFDDIKRAALAAGEVSGTALETGTRDALDTHSPSKAFKDIGRDAMAGYNQGVAKESGAVQYTAGGATGVSAGAGPASGRSGSSGPVTVNLSPSIQIDGSASPQETAQEVRRVLVTELGTAFESMAIQAGAA